MSESLDRGHEVPELTAEQIQARVLHRDGLMLGIDKPAGLPPPRRPKGGRNLDAPLCSTATPQAVSGWDAIARPRPRSACCSSMARFQKPIGRWSRAAPRR